MKSRARETRREKEKIERESVREARARERARERELERTRETEKYVRERDRPGYCNTRLHVATHGNTRQHTYSFLLCVISSFQVFPFQEPRFWFLVCYAATQLATQLYQRCTQVVCSNKEARKRLTESNGTPVMHLGHINVVLK